MEKLLLIAFVLTPLAVCGPCPQGTFYYVSRGLCYWELIAQLQAAEAHALCGAVNQNGGLAFFPEPEAEKFVIKNLSFDDYAANVSGQCSANNGVCNTLWIGHTDVWGRTGAPSLWQGTKPSWRPAQNAIVNSTTGTCIQVYLSPVNTTRWYEVACSGSHRRSICVTWADEKLRMRQWKAREGKTTDSLLHSFTARSLIDCARKCNLRQQCASFNFRRANRMCELSYHVLDPPTQPLTSDPGFRHYELVR